MCLAMGSIRRESTTLANEAEKQSADRVVKPAMLKNQVYTGKLGPPDRDNLALS